MANRVGKRSIFGIGLVIVCAVAIGVVLVYVLSSSSSIAITDGKIIGSINADKDVNPSKSAKSDQPNHKTGSSGLPVPRFVSLKRSKVNVRRGPSSEHKIAWVFHHKGLPVEIVAEFEHWRRVRDSDGQEGWIYHTLLAGKRTITVAPWRNGVAVNLREAPAQTGSVIANVSAGAVGNIKQCTGHWCKVALGDYLGWINQSMLWGVYPNEKL